MPPGPLDVLVLLLAGALALLLPWFRRRLRDRRDPAAPTTRLPDGAAPPAD